MKRTILNIMLCLSTILVSGSLIEGQIDKAPATEPIVQPLDLPWEY